TREAQAAARKAEKERLNEEATVKPGEEPEDNGSAEAPEDEPVTPPTNPDNGGEEDDGEGGLAG
ncbi:MAG: hypothetical protein IKY42_08995, partial [Bacteroidaceae bacterium]|nr:hypothetical protein [Bacteroidaceae bacterium]